jgi:hypothetical protein
MRQPDAGGFDTGGRLRATSVTNASAERRMWAARTVYQSGRYNRCTCVLEEIRRIAFSSMRDFAI